MGEHLVGLQIQEDLPHERLEWRLERAGWGAMTLVLVAALAGLLGPGPLSGVTGGGADGRIRVHYNRFLRHQAPETLCVHVRPEAVRDGKLRLWLTRAYVQSIEIRHIEPEPESVEAGPERFTYTFNCSGSAGTFPLMFYFEAASFGPTPAAVGIEGGAQVEFTPFIFP